MTVAVQGFGNVGSWSARFAAEAGFRVVAVSDISGGTYTAAGLDLDALEQHRARGGVMADYPDGDRITNAELLALECSVLIPAAGGDVITGENSDDVRAQIIVEGANHPMSGEADAALNERGVTIAPDILANAGGVIVSYFEWTQNIQRFRWEEEQVVRELKRTLISAYRSVWEMAQQSGVTMRRAAYLIAVERVAEAIRLRGFV